MKHVHFFQYCYSIANKRYYFDVYVMKIIDFLGTRVSRPGRQATSLCMLGRHYEDVSETNRFEYEYSITNTCMRTEVLIDSGQYQSFFVGVLIGYCKVFLLNNNQGCIFLHKLDSIYLRKMDYVQIKNGP